MSGENSQNENEFGANEWLVAEMYAQYVENPDAVDKSWWPILERYKATQGTATTAPAVAAPAPAAATPAAPTPAAPTPATPTPAPLNVAPVTQPGDAAPLVARTTRVEPKPQPIPAQAPVTSSIAVVSEGDIEAQDELTVLKGMAKAIATNMDISLTIPTATSVRAIPAKLLIDNRIVINSHLGRTRGGKVSFTHIIGYAIIQAAKEFPSQNVYYDIIDDKPTMVQPAHINFGLAIDLPRPDGTRALVVPNIKRAERLNFAEFLTAYEDVVKRGRDNKLTADDYAGTTISLTNPGGIGTVHSVPRLSKGQGSIIGAGALEYPAEFQGMSESQLAKMGVGKIVTLTSTYDHRVIQGAGSGEFLKKVHELLLGERDFYDQIFADLRVPYEPIRWVADIEADDIDDRNKVARIQELINAYRVRGHLMADIDPLEYKMRSHPDLDVLTHGLSLWDLDRTFKTGGFGGKPKAMLRDTLKILRDTYCRTVGIEYMHIQDPEQRKWFQDQLEHPYAKPDRAVQQLSLIHI